MVEYFLRHDVLKASDLICWPWLFFNNI